MTNHKTCFFLLFCLLLLGGLVLLTDLQWVAAENHTTPQLPIPGEPVLRVGSVPDIPDLFDARDGDYSGFYADLWDAIATELDLRYEWVVIDTLPDVVENVRQGEIDVAAAHLSITAEREKVMDFTHSVFHEGYQLYIPDIGGAGTFDFFILLYEAGVFTIIGEALLVLLALAHVVWLVEKRKPDSDFHHGYLQGIEDAL